MKTLIFVLTLLFASVVNAQTFKFYWHDRWDTQEPSLIFRYDKLSHGVRDGAIFYCLGKAITKDTKPRFIAATSFAVAYEIWDGFRWRKTGGFSFHDVAAGLAGQGIVYLGEKIFDKPKSKHDKTLRKELEVLRARVKELEKNKIVITPSPMPSILPYNDNPHFQPVPLRRTDVPHVILNIDSLGATFSVDNSFTIIGESKIK